MIGPNKRDAACGILESLVACLFAACSVYDSIVLLAKESTACFALILIPENWNPKEMCWAIAISYGNSLFSIPWSKQGKTVSLQECPPGTL